MIIYTLEKEIGNTISLYFPFSLHVLSYTYICIVLMPLVHHAIEREDDCRRETFPLLSTVIKEAFVFGHGKMWEIYCNHVAASATEVSVQ